MANEGRQSDIEQVAAEDIVPPEAATEHGYWGYRPDRTDRAEFTIAGVTGGTAQAATPPPAEPAAQQRANTEALKGTGKAR